jgi:hypothetical protein
MEDKVNHIKQSIKDSLQGFIGNPTSKKAQDSIKNRVSLATQRCLHNLGAQMHGGQVISCGTMWERFSWKQKLKWLVINRLMPWVGNIGRDQYEEGRRAWYENQDPEDDEFYPVKLNPLYELNPEGILQTDVSIKLVEPVEFIGIKLAIENGEVTDGRD